MVDDVSQLVYLHLRFHGYGDGKWTDSAVRRYVADAGELLPRLHKLVRADCTTRNKAACGGVAGQLRQPGAADRRTRHRRIWLGCVPTSMGTRSCNYWESRRDRRSVRPGTT